MNSTQRFTILLVIALVLPGCSIFAPQTSSLEAVHESYAEEFANAVLPAASANDGVSWPTGATLFNASFDKTLAAIKEFEKDYGTDSVEAAHLLVLKGMIYIQTGKPGMARLLAKDIEKNRGKLRSKAAVETRDSLFAACFSHLVTGWSEIYEEYDDQDATYPERKKLLAAAEGIESELDGLDDNVLGEPSVSSACSYLANTAAIFYMWTYLVGKSSRDPGAPAGSKPPYKENSEQHRADFAKKGAAVMERFLSDAEKRGEIDESNRSRVRYVQWYQWLSRTAGN